jgi:hypothetical protein
MVEIWKDIPGFLDYQVSNLGRVKSLKREKEKILKPQKRTKGYLCVGLRSYKLKPKFIDIHRLVLMSFVGMPPQGMECDHINRVRDDNRLDNLRWVTKRDNVLNSSSTKIQSELFYPGVKINYDRNKKYRVQFRINGKDVHFGTFYTFEDAKQKAIQVKQNNIL